MKKSEPASTRRCSNGPRRARPGLNFPPARPPWRRWRRWRRITDGLKRAVTIRARNWLGLPIRRSGRDSSRWAWLKRSGKRAARRVWSGAIICRACRWAWRPSRARGSGPLGRGEQTALGARRVVSGGSEPGAHRSRGREPGHAAATGVEFIETGENQKTGHQRQAAQRRLGSCLFAPPAGRRDLDASALCHKRAAVDFHSRRTHNGCREWKAVSG